MKGDEEGQRVSLNLGVSGVQAVVRISPTPGYRLALFVMFRKEIPFDPHILTRIADRRQVEGKEITLADFHRSGTYQLREQLRDLIDEFLFGRQRQVLALFLARKTFSEIAVILGISKDSVFRYYRRAVERLRKVSNDPTTSGEVSAA